jgi:hypothetical protein
MKPALYLVDLDRTLFSTSEFAYDLFRVVEQEFGLDAAQFEANIPHYTLPAEIGYDFFDHIKAVTGQSANAVTRRIAHKLPRPDYAYPDVMPWLEHRRTAGDIVIIVTVGQTGYQELKISYAPCLKGLPRLIVGQDKGLLLRHTLEGATDPTDRLDIDPTQYRSITFIDDNPQTFYELGPHPDIKAIFMDRSGEKYSGQPTPPHAKKTASLEELS